MEDSEEVSIQPKPKNGLEVAEAKAKEAALVVSIQPKPKNGLEACNTARRTAENAVSIQPKPKNGLEENCGYLLQ